MFKKVIGVLATVAGLLSGSVLNLTDAQSKLMDQYCMPDPQVWGMIKYGGLTPDLYTGTVRAEIPIYTYTDPDFEIPVSLTYASNGYMPNTQANFCGLGWSLNAGGCITRRVQGERDELGNAGFYFGTMDRDLSLQGYYAYVSGSFPHEVGHGDNLVVDVNSNYYYKSPETNLQYETEPDIFMFSFPGHSGKFVIQSDAKAVVYDSNVPSGEFHVDLTDFAQSWPKSVIRISTSDGYEYTFGGLEEDVNQSYVNPTTYIRSYAQGSDSLPLEDSSNEPVNCDSWHLKEIKAPNGRKVKFTYKIDDETKMQTYEPGASYSTEVASRIGLQKINPVLDLNQSVTLGRQNASVWVLDRTRNLILPLMIDIDSTFRIEFTYSDRRKESGLFSVSSELATPQKLSAIKAVDSVSGDTITSASLDYRYPAAKGNQVMMLSKVSISGLGDYQMEYYHETDPFPVHGSWKVDHWGYYNSSTADGIYGILPHVKLDRNYDEVVLSNWREPDPAQSLLGMLKTLSYPTGGHTGYEYEAHDYSRIAVRNSLTRGHYRLDSFAGKKIAGGLRLKAVTDHASDGVTSTKTYRYETDDGRSSGIMMNYPRYAMCAIKDTIDVGGNHIYHYRNEHSSSCPGHFLDDVYLGYSCVCEEYGDGSRMVTRFTSWEEYPDMLDDNDPPAPTPPSDETQDIPYYPYTYPSHFHDLFRTPNSAASLRGKVMTVEHYGTEGDLLKTEHMDYDGEWDELDYVKSVRIAIDSTYIHHIVCESPRLNSLRTTVQDGLFRKEVYGYNAQDQMISTSVIDEGGAWNSTYYFHPQDIAADNRTDMEQEMVDSNFISVPVYVVSTSGSGTSAKITSSIRTDFKELALDNLKMFVKDSEKMAEIPSGLTSVTPSSDAVLTQAGSLVYRTMFMWNDYNTAGRPCHTTDMTGMPSLLIWGYGGLYPVAMLNNVAPAQMATAVHASNAHRTVLGWSGMDSVTETVLRGIGNSEMTVWKWKPFVGISKKTGPDGRTTNWSYDEHGRLESVTGPDGYKISEYRYNIK